MKLIIAIVIAAFVILAADHDRTSGARGATPTVGAARMSPPPSQSSTLAAPVTPAQPTTTVAIVHATHTTHKPIPVTTETVPATMPENIKKLQERIPDAEMGEGDCEFITGCDDDPSVATDYINQSAG